MPRKRLRPRYLVEIAGRSYWQPSAQLRADGWKTVRLHAADGDIWLQAEAVNRKVDLWRAGLPIGGGRAPKGTVGWLVDEYLACDEFQELARKTQAGYRSDGKLLKDLGGEGHKRLGDRQLAAIDETVVQATKKALRPRGLFAANGIMRTARLVWSWGVRGGLVKTNP